MQLVGKAGQEFEMFVESFHFVLYGFKLETAQEAMKADVSIEILGFFWGKMANFKSDNGSVLLPPPVFLKERFTQISCLSNLTF